MRVQKLVFIPLFFLICLVAVNSAGDLNAETANLLSPFLEKYFKGDVKENVQKFIQFNWEHLKRQDDVAEVKEKLEEIYRTLTFKENIFEKEKEAGIRSQEYITKLKNAYEKWEKLQKHLTDWTRVEESIPNKRWTEIEKGPEVLQDIQELKSQVETHMSELEAEHNVYASRKTQIEKGGENAQQTHDKVKAETLAQLQSTVEKLIAQKVDIFKKLETVEVFREKHLTLAAQSWIDEKLDLIEDTKNCFENIADEFKKALSIDEKTGNLSEHLNPKKIKEDLKEKFNKIVEYLVTQYEKKNNENRAEEHDDDKITKIRQQIIHEKIQFKKQHHYIHDTRFSLVDSKLSNNPLQIENALIELINAILKRGPKNPTKRFAEKLLAKTKLLRDSIANSSACRFSTNGKTTADYTDRVTLSAKWFKDEGKLIFDQPPSTPFDLLSQQIKLVTEKHHRKFQKMLEYFSRMEQCVQTWRDIEDTVAKVEQWKK